MKKHLFATAALMCLVGLPLTGCDVKKTQDGQVTLPKFQVEKTQEGQLTLPKYDVKTPDVQVSKTNKEVTVPKLTTEKETVAVPHVTVTPAHRDTAEKK